MKNKMEKTGDWKAALFTVSKEPKLMICDDSAYCDVYELSVTCEADDTEKDCSFAIKESSKKAITVEKSGGAFTKFEVEEIEEDEESESWDADSTSDKQLVVWYEDCSGTPESCDIYAGKMTMSSSGQVSEGDKVKSADIKKIISKDDSPNARVTKGSFSFTKDGIQKKEDAWGKSAKERMLKEEAKKKQSKNNYTVFANTVATKEDGCTEPNVAKSATCDTERWEKSITRTGMSKTSLGRLSTELGKVLQEGKVAKFEKFAGKTSLGK